MTHRSRIASQLPALLAILLAAATALGSSATMLVGAGTARAQPEESTTRFLDLTIDSITPTVGSTTNNRLSVTGSVSNVGDRRVSDVSVRLQRGPRLTETDDVRTAPGRDQTTFDVVGPFVDISSGLMPGESSAFTLTLPLFADPSDTSGTGSLDVTSAGMYPLLVNVNGTPDFGGPARLDDSRFLLPVISTPYGAQASSGATPTTLLWPLAAPAALVGGIPGSTDEVTLTSDELATSLAAGGRLDGQVAALSNALDAEAGRGTNRPLAESVCLAIDPDLLVTVVNMTRGYRVLADPDNPESDTVAGVGAAAAAGWLDRLRALAARRCVIALPFGQTDLDRVAATGSAELLHSALQTPADVVDSDLGVTSADVVWPTDGTLDSVAAAAVASERPGAGLILAQPDESTDPDSMSGTGADTGSAAGTPAAPIASYDRILSATLADMGVRPMAPTDPSTDVTPASKAARVQNAVAATYWHIFADYDRTDRSLVIAPPQIWEADADGAAAVLEAITAQFAAARMAPQPLDDALTNADRPVSSGPATSATGDTGEADGGTDADVRRVARIGSRINDLRAALSNDTPGPPTPDQFVAPLWEDLVRALAGPNRADTGGADPAGADTDAGDAVTSANRRRIDAVDAELTRIVDSVSVVAPGGVFTLASEQSPMLLVARNDLPVPIVVALRFDAPDGVTVGDIGLQQLPARGSRSLQVPVRLADSRSLPVEVALTTPTGTALGDASTVTVRSSNYGTAFTVITVIAGAVLLLLVGRRLWHRFRGKPDPADRR